MKTKKIDKKLNFQKSTVSNLESILGGEKSTLNPSVCPCVYTYTKCQTQCPSGVTPYACNLC